jgi:hypothetical protein
LAHFFIGGEKDVGFVAKLPTFHHVRDDGIEGSLALAEELRKLRKKELLVYNWIQVFSFKNFKFMNKSW